MRLLALVALGAGAARAEPRVHTVFCAECTNNFDYKSIGVFWSHKLAGMPGGRPGGACGTDLRPLC